MLFFRQKIIWLNIIIVSLFIIDRASKWLALNVLPREGLFIIPQSTGFILERNQGIAYSIALPQPYLGMVVAIIILIFTGLLVRAYQRQELRAIAALSLIICGAFSNLIDRLRYDYVVDMLVLTSWPVFNLADILILAGAVWLVFVIFKKQKAV